MEQVLLKPKPPPGLSLPKEPGTGQTIHINLNAPEDVAKAEASPEPQAILKKDRDGASAPRGKSRSKKKLKQQQKREEKLRKREKEREREREREKEREREREREQERQRGKEIEEEDEEQLEKPQGSEATDKDSTGSTNSLEDDGSDQVSAVVLEKAPGQFDVSGGDTEILEAEPGKVTHHSSLEATEESFEPENEDHAELAVPVDQVPDNTGTARKPSERRLPPQYASSSSSYSSSSSSPSPIQGTVDSVPATAIRTSRGWSSKQHQQQHLEQILSDPFSQTPDRSTYSSKKSASRKQSGDATKLEKDKIEHEQKAPTPEIEVDMTEDDSFSEALDITEPPPGTDFAVSDTLMSPELEADGPLSQQHMLSAPKPSQVTPTSPHELAASLLSSKLRRRTKTGDKDKGGAGEEDGVDAKGESGQEEATESPGVSPVKYGHPPIADKAQQKSSSAAGSGSHHIKHRPPHPTTLSLDARPFYPSADFNRMQTKLVDRERQRYSNTLGDFLPPSLNPPPPGFQQSEPYCLYSPEKKYRRRDPRSYPKPLTPSPPFMAGDGQQFFGESPFDLPDPVLAYGDPRLYDGGPGGHRVDPHYPELPDEPQPIYSLGRIHDRGGGGELPMGSSQQHRPRGMPQYHNPTYPMSMQQQQQQQFLARRRAAAMAAAAREHHPSGFGGTPPSSWDQPRRQSPPLAHPMRPLTHEEELQLKRYMFYREQAQKSAEVLSSINKPYRSGRNSTFIPPESTTNLWENTSYDPLADTLPMPPPPPPLPPAHPQHSMGVEDSIFSESMHAYQLRRQQLLQEQAATRQLQAQRSNYSDDGDLGGEIVTNLQSTLQSQSLAAPPGLNRAPGSAFSSTGGAEDRPRLRQRASPLDGSLWNSDSTEVSVQHVLLVNFLWSMCDRAL